jgi:hypothetical protein
MLLAFGDCRGVEAAGGRAARSAAISTPPKIIAPPVWALGVPTGLLMWDAMATVGVEDQRLPSCLGSCRGASLLADRGYPRAVGCSFRGCARDAPATNSLHT